MLSINKDELRNRLQKRTFMSEHTDANTPHNTNKSNDIFNNKS